MKIIEANKEYNVVVKENGDKFWYWQNRLHREAGPAIELATGGKVWYWEGQKITSQGQKTFEQQVKIIKTATQNKYYDVRVECMVPATITYRILASSPEDALVKTRHSPIYGIQYRIPARKELKATILDAGTSIIRFVKNLAGY